MAEPEEVTRADAAIGGRIRRRRIELGLTQEQLACRVGISYQQIQKYERGANRISASRLYSLACRLDVAPAYFFVDLPAPDGPREAVAERPLGEVARHYARIEDEGVRSAVAGLLRTVVERQG